MDLANEFLGEEVSPMRISDDLDDSLPLNFYLTTESHIFWEGFTEDLYITLNLGTHYKEGRLKTLGFVILNLFYMYQSGRAGWIGYSRTPNCYSSKSRYNPQAIAWRPTLTVVDSLINAGLVEHHIGVNYPNFKRQSRMAASANLIKIFQSHPEIFNDSLIQGSIEPELIILKDIHKKKLEYTDTEFTEDSRTLLQRYNTLLKNTFVDINLQNEDWVKLKKKPNYLKFDVLNKITYRIFNDDRFDRGGRFYGGWWQNIPSYLRSRIVINNKATVEYDFRAIHVVLLYAVHGVDYFAKYGVENDPYLDDKTLADFRVVPKHRDAYRKLFKKTFMCCINSRNGRAEAKKALANAVRKDQELRELKPDIDMALNCFERQHDLIRTDFYSGIGLRLMNIDSMLAEAVIRHFTDTEKLPVLCIHDSFICVKRDDNLMVDVLKQVINNELLGREIPIPIDSLFTLKESTIPRAPKMIDGEFEFVTDDIEIIFKSLDMNLENRFQSWVQSKKQTPFKVKL